MEYSTLSVSLENGVACIVLNRPEVMNALNTQMRAEIAEAATSLGKEARVVVLTGTGRAFCSGQDLGDRTNASNIDMERTLRDEYEPMLRAIIDCPVPTITALNGAAAGAGANLALAADVVIAAHSAYLMQAFTRIGLIPDAGGTYVMPRTMGFAKAMGASLFADKITAVDAANSGLIWEAVPEESFEETWKARAAQLANGPTLAYQNVKKAIRASLGTRLTSNSRSKRNCKKNAAKPAILRKVCLRSVKAPAKFEGR